MKIIKQLLKDFKIEPTGNAFLDGRYDPNSPYYRFFYQLTKELKPGVVVELGSWQGTSAAYFAGGNPETTVITIDHHTDPGDSINKSATQKAELAFSNLHYVNGWTCDQLYEEEKDKHLLHGLNAYPRVLEILAGRKIDILFIDSWHRYDQAMKDWNAYKPLLNKGAIVICDDICPGNKGGGIEDMDKFWDEIKHDKFLTGALHSGYPMGFFRYD